MVTKMIKLQTIRIETYFDTFEDFMDFKQAYIEDGYKIIDANYEKLYFVAEKIIKNY